MAKSLKNKILKQFDTAYEGFPPDRSLHLAQSVFATIAETAEAEVQVDVSTLTIADICRELSELVIAKRLEFEELVEEIEHSKINGRLSASLLDSNLTEASIQRRRALDDRRAAEEAEAIVAAAEAKAAAEAQAKVATRRSRAKKIVPCSTCGAEQGMCDCAQQAAANATRLAAAQRKKELAAAKLLKQQAARALVPEESVHDSDTDDEEKESDEADSDDDGDTTSALVARGSAAKSLKTLDLDDPGCVLDPEQWRRLAIRFSQTELQHALTTQYRDVCETYRHDASFIISTWLQFAAVLRFGSHGPGAAEAVKGIKLCRARFEFMLGKKTGIHMASTVEAELLDQSLPPDLRKARKAGRRSQQEAEKAKPKTPAPKPTPKK